MMIILSALNMETFLCAEGSTLIHNHKPTTYHLQSLVGVAPVVGNQIFGVACDTPGPLCPHP